MSITEPTSTQPPPAQTGPQQYLRRVQLLVGDQAHDVDLSNLHIKFSIRMFTLQTNNIAEVRVYNLDGDTAAKIDAEFFDLTLNAGYYGGDFETIFKGTIVQVRRSRDDPADTYVDITAQDGDLATNYAIVSYAMGAGSTFNQRAQVLAKAMNLTIPSGGLPDLAQLPPEAQQALPRGKTMFIKASEAVRDAAMHAMCSWSVQNGELVMVPYQGYLDREVPDINAGTGMIGWPEQSQEGIVIKTLLNPKLVPFGRVRLNNKDIKISELSLSRDSYASANSPELSRPLLDMDGIYVLHLIEHSGDTGGTEYYTTMLGIAQMQEQIPESVISAGHNNL